MACLWLSLRRSQGYAGLRMAFEMSVAGQSDRSIAQALDARATMRRMARLLFEEVVINDERVAAETPRPELVMSLLDWRTRRAFNT